MNRLGEGLCVVVGEENMADAKRRVRKRLKILNVVGVCPNLYGGIE
jgi:hypothetical protein